MTMVDATTLPGRSNRSETNVEVQVDDITAALRELSGGLDSKSNMDIRQDTQWKHASRLSLRNITSRDELQELYDTITELQPHVEGYMFMAMDTIFEKYHWGHDIAKYWSQGNLMARVSKDSITFYVDLLGHLMKMDRDHGWAYTKVALDYHSKKLTDIRTTALTRLGALVRIYVYLRDAKAVAFNGPKLQEKRTTSLYEQVASLEQLVSVATAPKCPKCHGSTRVHASGRKNCIFGNCKDGVARAKAAAIEQAFKDSTQDE